MNNTIRQKGVHRQTVLPGVGGFGVGGFGVGGFGVGGFGVGGSGVGGSGVGGFGVGGFGVGGFGVGGFGVGIVLPVHVFAAEFHTNPPGQFVFTVPL